MNTQVALFNTFNIETELGAGGGGTVYKAWHTRLQKHVVIKEYKRGLSCATETRCSEVEALKNVKSPYLPQIYDVIAEHGSVFSVMEYIEGESFDKLLGRGRIFSPPEVVRWYSQLASALEKLHEKDVCHRDIKPANIMLAPGGDVCLIDFNAALVKGNSAKFISRSLGYASPEQYELFERYAQNGKSTRIEASFAVARMAQVAQRYGFFGDACPDGTDGQVVECSGEDNKTQLSDSGCLPIISNSAAPAPYSQPPIPLRLQTAIDWKLSDIYSLGATMHHILTGKRPQERAANIIAIPKRDRLNSSITRIILKSMHPEPKNRFASASELAEAIQHIEKYKTGR